MAALDACPECLRRSYLIAHLAPRIAGLLQRPGRRAPGLLALSERDLIAAVAGDGATEPVRFLDSFDARDARSELDAAGITSSCQHGGSYPPPLLELDDPPAVLFHTGRPERLARLSAEPAVALVGTRRPSPYGLEVAYALGRGLGAAGITVVSGMALGIDAAGHRGCLDSRGGAIAVLAGGPDVPYPRQNVGLYRQLVEHGVVLSEMPPGRRAFRWSFPARNRIMAGLARMTLVVEASEPSGSLITAEFAQDLGRAVGAVPGRVTAFTAKGCNRLISDGARLVRSGEDVLEELFGVCPATRMAALPSAEPDENLDPMLRKVLERVEAGEGVDAIVVRTGEPVPRVKAALGRLEQLGYLARDALGAYERTARKGMTRA